VFRQLAEEAPAAIETFGIVSKDLLELGINISKVVAPALEGLIAAAGEMFEAFNNLPPGVQKATVAVLALGPAVTALSATVSGVLGVLGTFAGSIGTLVGIGTTLSTVLGGVAAILGGPLTVALLAGAAAVAAYKTNFLGFRDIVNDVIEEVNELIDAFSRLPDRALPTASETRDQARSVSERGGPAASAGGSGIVGVESGGQIERGGLAMLHAGERVVPEAQVSDRGGVQTQDINVELRFEGGGEAEQALWNTLRDNVDVKINDELERAGRRANDRGRIQRFGERFVEILGRDWVLFLSDCRGFAASDTYQRRRVGKQTRKRAVWWVYPLGVVLH
jgi:hypothetical protein